MNSSNLKTFQDLYENKDYKGAESFLNGLRSDIGEWNYHYNLGVLKVHQGELALARFHYLQALKNDDSAIELKANLKSLETQLSVQVHEKPQGINDQIFQQMFSIPDAFWSTLSLVFIIVGLIVIRKNFRPLQVSLVALLGSIPLGLYFWFIGQGQFLSLNEATLYEGPSEIFKGQFTIPAGVRVLATQNGEWTRIYYPSKFEGWVKKENLINLRSK